MIVPIDQVIADSRCQSRTGIDLGLVHDYAEAIRTGVDMPPMSVIDSGNGMYLYDGFHRIEAYRQAGVKKVPVSTEAGDLWDAIERSCAVNADHGKRRTNEDKHRAVETMIKVMEHKGENWSNNEVARRCSVSHQFVNNLRPILQPLQDAPRSAVRDGKPYEMNTANIGRTMPNINLDGLNFDHADEDVDEETGEILDTPARDLPSSFEALPTKDVWFMIPDGNAREAAILIRQNMLPETVAALVNHLQGRA